MNDALILMEGIDKRFPGVQALKDCQFNLRRGEVHALVGENGAGKSTLMKILAGIYPVDSGTIIFKGQEVTIPNPHTAQTMGISMVHQELNLMAHLTAAQNIFIGREPIKGFLLDETTQNKKTKEIFELMNLNLDPTMKVSKMTVAKQQMVEIAKALSFNADVLIFDEPSGALTDVETAELFRIIRQLKADGTGIIYITHRMEELKEISDRITVLRDGLYVDTVNTRETSINQIINMMVGRVIYESSPEIPEERSQEIVLEVKNLSRGNELKDVSFQLMKGEILGFAGLIGAGRTETARAIFGADPIDSGEVYIKGKPVHIKRPSDAVAHDIAYLSEDRKRYGLCLSLDLKTNIVLPIYQKLTSVMGWVKDKRAYMISKELLISFPFARPAWNKKQRTFLAATSKRWSSGSGWQKTQTF
jgi:ribose transport system ATP-binding protein